METKELDLVQLIRQLKDYVILDRKDYEKLVQNSKPIENESALEARDAQITLLQKQLSRQEEHTSYTSIKVISTIMQEQESLKTLQVSGLMP